MRKCPFCLQEIPEDAKVCKHCSKTVVKRCTSCNQEIVATAIRCRYCGVDLAAPAAKPIPVTATVVPNDAPCGERREIVMTLVLILVTCGFYGLYLLYQMGSEINRHSRRNELNPGLDLVLIFLTCGFWGWYVMYRYPKALQDLIMEEGGPTTDLVLPCLIFALFGMHIVSYLILQGELNKHWELHQSAPA
jgi:hypothetical protein